MPISVVLDTPSSEIAEVVVALDSIVDDFLKLRALFEVQYPGLVPALDSMREDVMRRMTIVRMEFDAERGVSPEPARDEAAVALALRDKLKELYGNRPRLISYKDVYILLDELGWHATERHTADSLILLGASKHYWSWTNFGVDWQGVTNENAAPGPWSWASAALYFQGETMGNIHKVDARDVQLKLTSWAQYKRALEVTFTPKGKRKARKSILTPDQFFALVPPGIHAPDPDSMWDPATKQERPGVATQRGRYMGFDPRWVTDFEPRLVPGTWRWQDGAFAPIGGAPVEAAKPEREQTKRIGELTEKQYELLDLVVNSQYHDGGDPVGNPVWQSEVSGHFGTSTGGVIRHALDAGLVGEDTSPRNKSEWAVWVTQKGYDAFMRAAEEKVRSKWTAPLEPSPSEAIYPWVAELTGKAEKLLTEALGRPVQLHNPIGSGNNGQVFQIPNGQVVKITSSLEEIQGVEVMKKYGGIAYPRVHAVVALGPINPRLRKPDYADDDNSAYAIVRDAVTPLSKAEVARLNALAPTYTRSHLGLVRDELVNFNTEKPVSNRLFASAAKRGDSQRVDQWLDDVGAAVDWYQRHGNTAAVALLWAEWKAWARLWTGTTQTTTAAAAVRAGGPVIDVGYGNMGTRPDGALVFFDLGFVTLAQADQDERPEPKETRSTPPRSRLGQIYEALVALGWTWTPSEGVQIEVGGGHTGGQLNPRGRRILVAQRRGPWLEAVYGETPIAQVEWDDSSPPATLAWKLHNLVQVESAKESVTVFNLSTGQEVIYTGITPREAVLAAYAQQEKKDHNTWSYEEKYGHLVRPSAHGYHLENWSVKAKPATSVRAGSELSHEERVMTARRLGREAFERGAKAVPALDVHLRPLLAGYAVGAKPSSLEILEAWSDGWHTANMAAPVEEVEADEAEPTDLTPIQGASFPDTPAGRAGAELYDRVSDILPGWDVQVFANKVFDSDMVRFFFFRLRNGEKPVNGIRENHACFTFRIEAARWSPGGTPEGKVTVQGDALHGWARSEVIPKFRKWTARSLGYDGVQQAVHKVVDWIRENKAVLTGIPADTDTTPEFVPAPPAEKARAKFHAAFEKLRSKGLNLVPLARLRAALGWSPSEFDRVLGDLRKDREYVLHTHDGRHGKLSPAEEAAAIYDDGRRFVYAARIERVEEPTVPDGIVIPPGWEPKLVTEYMQVFEDGEGNKVKVAYVTRSKRYEVTTTPADGVEQTVLIEGASAAHRQGAYELVNEFMANPPRMLVTSVPVSRTSRPEQSEEPSSEGSSKGPGQFQVPEKGICYVQIRMGGETYGAPLMPQKDAPAFVLVGTPVICQTRDSMSLSYVSSDGLIPKHTWRSGEPQPQVSATIESLTAQLLRRIPGQIRHQPRLVTLYATTVGLPFSIDKNVVSSTTGTQVRNASVFTKPIADALERGWLVEQPAGHFKWAL